MPAGSLQFFCKQNHIQIFSRKNVRMLKSVTSAIDNLGLHTSHLSSRD